MEWQVKPITRACAATGRELAPGDLVTCVVHKPVGGMTPHVHVRTQQILQVPAIDLQPADIQRVQATLDLLIG